MDAELKAKWVKALRSGKYKQHFGELFPFAGRFDAGSIADASAHCCIGVGVLCTGASADNTTRASVLLGLTEKQRDALINLNDEERRSFPEIADYIEREL